jgi:STAS-like domain of unknown function (DUF4325)
MKTEINLNKYLPIGVKVFTGRDWGADVRKRSNIDDVFAHASGKVHIILPPQIRSINPSFLEELFKNIVLKYGHEDFLARIECNPVERYNIDADLEEAIDRILTEENALAI